MVGGGDGGCSVWFGTGASTAGTAVFIRGFGILAAGFVAIIF